MTPDSSDLGWALDEALDALAAGEGRDAILSRFARQAEALAPLLEAAEAGRQGLAGPVPAFNLARGRQRFLQAARRRRPPAPVWRAAPARLALAGLLVVVLAVAGAGAASAGSLPGDALYPFKRALEEARLAVTVDPGARAAYADALRARRRLEAAQAAGLGREAAVTFEGQVEAVQTDQLLVSGVVLLTPNGATVEIGDTILVVGHTRSGHIIADRIEVLRSARVAPATAPPQRPSPTSPPVRATPSDTPQRPASSVTPARHTPTASASPAAPRATTTPESARPAATPSPQRPAGLLSEPTSASDRPPDPSPTTPPAARPTETALRRP
jgi:hypothetical protein